MDEGRGQSGERQLVFCRMGGDHRIVRPQISTYRPPEDLRQVVVHFWSFLLPTDSDVTSDADADLILPDYGAELIFGGEAGGERIVLRGPQNKLGVVRVVAGVLYWGIRLAPGGACGLFGLTGRDLIDQRRTVASWADLSAFGRTADEAMPATLSAWMRQLVYCGRPRTRSAPGALAAKLIVGSRGLTPAAEIAARVGCSLRHLNREMIRDVGYSPKAFARIVRFRGAVARLYALPSEPLVQVALAAGYADQAHMTRDFAGFAGMSPAKLRGLMMSDSFKPPAHLQ